MTSKVTAHTAIEQIARRAMRMSWLGGRSPEISSENGPICRRLVPASTTSGA